MSNTTLRELGERVKAAEPDYDSIYRRLNPRIGPPCPYGRRPELRDLWPVDQQDFRDMVDAARRSAP